MVNVFAVYLPVAFEQYSKYLFSRNNNCLGLNSRLKYTLKKEMHLIFLYVLFQNLLHFKSCRISLCLSTLIRTCTMNMWLLLSLLLGNASFFSGTTWRGLFGITTTLQVYE